MTEKVLNFLEGTRRDRLLRKMCDLGEVSRCKFFCHTPNPLHVTISFVFYSFPIQTLSGPFSNVQALKVLGLNSF
jgi:hypothetical protein